MKINFRLEFEDDELVDSLTTVNNSSADDHGLVIVSYTIVILRANEPPEVIVIPDHHHRLSAGYPFQQNIELRLSQIRTTRVEETDLDSSTDEDKGQEEADSDGRLSPVLSVPLLSALPESTQAALAAVGARLPQVAVPRSGAWVEERDPLAEDGSEEDSEVSQSMLAFKRNK
jgi:hypothetical protein